MTRPGTEWAPFRRRRPRRLGARSEYCHWRRKAIARPPEDVWRAIGTPERWLEGYLETRSRSADYPAAGTRDDHVYHTRMNENVETQVTVSEAPIASRDIKKRWDSSLKRLKAAAEGGGS